MAKIQINDEVRDMTAAEESALKSFQDNAKAERDKMISDKDAKDNLKASAKAKLIAGEALTEDEANELVGV